MANVFGWLLYAVERVLAYFGQGEIVSGWQETRRRTRDNAARFTIFERTTSNIFSIQQRSFSSSKGMNLVEAAEIYVCETFPYANTETKKSLILLFLCAYYDDYNDANVYQAIKTYADMVGLSFHTLSENGKQFLALYEGLVSNKEIQVSAIATTKCSDEKKFLRDFAQKYQKNLVLEFVTEQLAQSEELRKTLVDLIDRGKLSAFGVTKKTIKSLEARMNNQARSAKTFLIIANKLDDPNIKRYIATQPGFTGWTPRSKNIPGKKQHIFAGYVFRPSEGFSSAKELIAKFKSLTSAQHEWLVAIFPFDSSGFEWYTLPANKTFTNQKLTDALEVISHFKSGTAYNDADLWNEIISSDVDVNELLSLIPFNIFVPGIYPSEREFLIKAHEPLQNKFRLKTLADWADVDSELLAKELQAIGAPAYTPNEDAALGNKKDGRIGEIAKSIVDNAKKFRRSLQLLTM